MAKNVKSNNFVKSEEIVFLGNTPSKDIETKNSVQATTRRSISRSAIIGTPCATKSSITKDEIKYQAIQPKITPETSRTQTTSQRSVVIHPINKSVAVPIVSISELTSIPTNSQCDAEGKSPVLRQQQEMVIRRKPNANRSGIGPKKGPKQRIIISNESPTSTHLFYSQKQEQSPNGQSCLNRTPIINRTATLGSGVIITEISGSGIIQKANNVVVKPPPAKAGDSIICSRCSVETKYADKCEHCHQAFIGASIRSLSKTLVQSKDSVTQTPSRNAAAVSSAIFSQEAFYGTKVQEPQAAQCIRQVTGNKVIVREMGQPMGTRGRPKGSKNRVPEPVCLTISSDDDEPMDTVNDRRSISEISSANNNSLLLRQQPPRAVANTSNQQRQQVHKQFMSLRTQDRESKKYDEAGIKDEESSKILKQVPLPDEEEELEDEEEMMDDEERYQSEELNTSSEGNEKEPVEVVTAQGQQIIQCRSIRIGSFKIHPKPPSTYVPVVIGNNSYSFQGPTLKSCNDTINVILEEKDLAEISAHVGRCLPIMFITVTPPCAERIRKQVGMVKNETVYFDPESSDLKQKYITLLIEVLGDQLRAVVRGMLPSIFKELDQKGANEILVKSTPNQSPTPPAMPVLIQAIPKNISVPPSSQVTKILTYPPPPQTGGIEITSDDLACLNDGEFLNDAIIDFYLKYLMHEKLSEEDRARTHIFNSFFYPRLTQKPLTRGKSEEGSSISVKRHTQVKSWTKNVDIFSKDFIIIPINQNVHWFLAIICNPGQVPETTPNMSGKSVSSQKSAGESVTSSNDQESCCSPEASCSSSLTDAESGRCAVTMKDQACSTEDSSSDESSPSSFGYANGAESSYTEEDANKTPDSTTNPDRGIPNTKSTRKPQMKTQWGGPCILIFDSLPGPSRVRIINTLREYLEIEWRMRKNSHRAFNKLTMQGYTPNVPLQSNYSDCGVYVLQYVESFFENPLPYYCSTIPELEDWFSKEKIGNKREEIRNLILELQKRQLSSSAVISSSTSERVNSRQIAEHKITSVSVQKS